MTHKHSALNLLSIAAFAVILIFVAGGLIAAVHDAWTGPPWRCVAYELRANEAIPFLGVQRTHFIACATWVRP